MLDATDFRMACWGLALGVAMIAVFLHLHQRHARRWRESSSEEEDIHFHRQDLRRRVGVAVMLALALDVFAGSWVEPKVAGRGNPWFAVVWILVLSLVVVLLTLAFFDLLATRGYARRSRRELFLREIEEVFRRRRRLNGEPGDTGEGPSGEDEAVF